VNKLIYSTDLRHDVDRIAAHLIAHQVPDVEGRIAEILDAFQLLIRNPLIGRLADKDDCRELVIGVGVRGYVALYSYDALDDKIVILALRAQRESGFRGR